MTELGVSRTVLNEDLMLVKTVEGAHSVFEQRYSLKSVSRELQVKVNSRINLNLKIKI